MAGHFYEGFRRTSREEIRCRWKEAQCVTNDSQASYFFANFKKNPHKIPREIGSRTIGYKGGWGVLAIEKYSHCYV